MSKIRIANPQSGREKYTTVSRAEQYVRRKEAVIVHGMLAALGFPLWRGKRRVEQEGEH